MGLAIPSLPEQDLFLAVITARKLTVRVFLPPSNAYQYAILSLID